MPAVVRDKPKIVTASQQGGNHALRLTVAIKAAKKPFFEERGRPRTGTKSAIIVHLRAFPVLKHFLKSRGAI
jgi:hypothetical protein